MVDRIVKFLLGLEAPSWAQDGKWSLQWSNAPTGDAALVLLLIGVGSITGVLMLYRWDARRLPRSLRLILSGCRCGVLLLAIAILLEPVILLRTTEWIPSHLLVLVDTSQSMGLRDAWQDSAAADEVTRQLGIGGGAPALRKMTRFEIAKTVLNSNLVEELKAAGDRTIHVHAFSDRIQDAGEAGELMLDLAGQRTAIGSALRQTMRSYRGMPLAGALLISDGQSNTGEPVAAAAESYAEEGVPIVTLGVGTTEGPRNVTLHEIEANPVVFVRDSNAITVYVRSRGIGDTPVTVTLEKQRNEGVWEEVGQEELAPDPDGHLQSVRFEYSEKKSGRLRFRAGVHVEGSESTTDDNVALAEVRVIRQKQRVLFIAGSTFPEVQFLRNSLLRDSRIEVSTWLMSADTSYEHPGDEPIQRLPTTQAEMNEFDCVILYDSNPALWPPPFSDMLMHFVAKTGGGFIYIAGEMQTSQLFDRQDDPAFRWMSLLPVVREPGLFRSEVQMRLSARSAWRLAVTPEGKRDTVFAFSSDSEQNVQILKSLPGMYWHFPVTRAKPGALVLAQHGDPRMRNEFGPEVLLATQWVGPGRTFFVGFDSTYRWRYLDEQFYDGFWARMIDRACRNRLLGGAYPFRLWTDQASYAPGSQVRIVARFLDSEDADTSVHLLHGQVEAGFGEPLPITLERTAEAGKFETLYPVSQAGTHLVKVWMGEKDSGRMVKAATLPIKVELPNLEHGSPQLDDVTLAEIAALSGGTSLGLWEAGDIARAFRIQRVARVLEDRQEIWNAPLLYGLLILLLFSEWVMRKRWRMI